MFLPTSWECSLWLSSTAASRIFHVFGCLHLEAMLLCWIVNEWHPIETLIIMWLDAEVRSLWLRTSHIVLAQCFSNPHVKLDLPHLLPLKHEKSLAIAQTRISLPLPLPGGRKKALSTVECLGTGFCGSDTVSRSRVTNSSFKERSVTFRSKSLQWLSAKDSSSDDFPAFDCLASLSLLKAKPAHSSHHYANILCIPMTTPFSVPAISPCSAPSGATPSCWIFINSSTSIEQEITSPRFN